MNKCTIFNTGFYRSNLYYGVNICIIEGDKMQWKFWKTRQNDRITHKFTERIVLHHLW